MTNQQRTLVAALDRLETVTCTPVSHIRRLILEDCIDDLGEAAIDRAANEFGRMTAALGRINGSAPRWTASAVEQLQNYFDSTVFA